MILMQITGVTREKVTSTVGVGRRRNEEKGDGKPRDPRNLRSRAVYLRRVVPSGFLDAFVDGGVGNSVSSERTSSGDVGAGPRSNYGGGVGRES